MSSSIICWFVSQKSTCFSSSYQREQNLDLRFEKNKALTLDIWPPNQTRPRTSPMPDLGHGLGGLVTPSGQPLQLPDCFLSLSLPQLLWEPVITPKGGLGVGHIRDTEKRLRDWKRMPLPVLEPVVDNGGWKWGRERCSQESWCFHLSSPSHYLLCYSTNPSHLHSPRAYPLIVWKEKKRGVAAGRKKRNEGNRMEGSRDRRGGPMTGPLTQWAGSV